MNETTTSPERPPGKKARAGHPSGRTDDWFTPMDLFGELHARNTYTVDVAGHAEAPVSQAIGRWWDIHQDGLGQSWKGERVWCNPPYSDIAPWVAKAHDEIRNGCELVSMLVPANRTDQLWWQTYVEPWRDFKGYLTATFIARRRRFGFPGDVTGKTGTSPTFGLVLLTWRRALPSP